MQSSPTQRRVGDAPRHPHAVPLGDLLPGLWAGGRHRGLVQGEGGRQGIGRCWGWVGRGARTSQALDTWVSWNVLQAGLGAFVGG